MIARGSLAPFTPLTPFAPFPLRDFGHPLIIHRIVRDSYPYERHPQPYKQAFTESFEGAVKGNNATAEKSRGKSIGKVMLFLAFIGLAGAVGFYLGKVNESRNYVRVPSMSQ